MLFSSVPSIKNCLKRGIGVSVCPEVSVHEELLSGDLGKLDWEEGNEATETTVTMIWHVGKWCSPPLQAFMDIARAVIV
jgi:DNA-binding transcriptional LysR family regulator